VATQSNDRLFAVIAALFALAGWFYQQSELRILLFAPLALGAIFCLASLLWISGMRRY